MGKSSKKSAPKVVEKAEDVTMAEPVKSLKKGKRGSEVVVEDLVPAKKQKVDLKKTEVKTKQKIAATVVESSSDDETSSESEGLKITKAAAAVAKNGHVSRGKKDSSSSSDDSEEEMSSDDNTAKTNKSPAVAVKKVTGSAPANRNESTDDSDSEDDSDDEATVTPNKKAPVIPTKKTSSASVQKKDESDESDSDDDSSSDEDDKNVILEVQPKKAPLSAANKKDSSDDDSDSTDETSSDEDAPAAKKTVTTAAKSEPATAAKKKEVSSSDDDSDEESQKKKVKSEAAVKMNSEAAEEESSSSEDDDEEETAAVAKKVVSKKSSSEESSEDEEDSDNSSSEDEKPSKTTQKKGADVKMVDPVPAKDNVGKGAASEKQPKTPSTPKAEGSKTIFMGNISFSVEQADVENFFKVVGGVTDIRFSMRSDGSFKGFAHVEFASAEAAEKAVHQLNGKDLLGRPVYLDLARERGSYTPNSGGRDASSFQKGGRATGQKVFVRGFDRYGRGDEIRGSLEELFGSCGNIRDIFLPTDQDGGLKGMAFITFEEVDAFNRALELNGTKFGGRALTVEESKPRPDKLDSAGAGGRGFGRGGRGGGRGDHDSGGRFGGRHGGRFGIGGRGRGTPNKPSLFASGKKTTFNDEE